jgi:hypothetical protein
MKDLALKVAGVIFAVVALMHLARLVWKIDIVAATVRIPMLPSVFGFIFASLLAVWMLTESSKK